jgi:predicted nuclease of predicted toxin-antitoxin system
MKFIVDNALSPLISAGLVEAGYDAVHVNDYDLGTATDETIFARAVLEDRIIISADTDFGTLLALLRETKPSFILFHKTFTHVPVDQLVRLLPNLTQLETDLSEGCIAVIEAKRIRVRRLPIAGED